MPARSVVIYDLKAECFEYAKAQRSIPRVPGKQFRTLWPFLSIIGYIGLAMVLSVHPAAAATTTGSAGFFQPVVTFVTDFKTTIQLILAPLCFIFWVGTVGSIVANGGQIHGLGWAMLAGALGTTALLVADLIISSFSSGALVV
ncbi:hypothetical protein EPN44_14405 [bacterium]|nr:MAG: hypothetical protein EPN44_14405 [bacterium]